MDRTTINAQQAQALCTNPGQAGVFLCEHFFQSAAGNQSLHIRRTAD